METNKHAGKQEPGSSSGPRAREAHGQRRAGSAGRAAWSQQQPNVSSEHFICRNSGKLLPAVEGGGCRGGAEERQARRRARRGRAPAESAPSRGRRAEGIGEQGARTGLPTPPH